MWCNYERTGQGKQIDSKPVFCKNMFKSGLARILDWLSYYIVVNGDNLIKTIAVNSCIALVLRKSSEGNELE